MQWLRSRLYESELQKRQAAAAERKSQVSTGDRSAKSEPITIRKEE